MEEGAVSLGIAILIFLYFIFFHNPKKRNVVYSSEAEQEYRAEFAKEQARVVAKVLKKTPSEFWKGKSEAEYRWLLKLNLSEDANEFIIMHPKPEPAGQPDYFEFLKANLYSGNEKEYELGVEIANQKQKDFNN